MFLISINCRKTIYNDLFFALQKFTYLPVFFTAETQSKKVKKQKAKNSFNLKSPRLRVSAV